MMAAGFVVGRPVALAIDHIALAGTGEGGEEVVGLRGAGVGERT